MLTCFRGLSFCRSSKGVKYALIFVFLQFLGVKACNIKKNFFGKPNPYVKINVLPRVRHLAASQKHHGPQGKSTPQPSTVDPKWEGEASFNHLVFFCDLLGSKPSQVLFPTTEYSERCTETTKERVFNAVERQVAH